MQLRASMAGQRIAKAKSATKKHIKKATEAPQKVRQRHVSEWKKMRTTCAALMKAGQAQEIRRLVEGMQCRHATELHTVGVAVPAIKGLIYEAMLAA